LGEGVRGLGFWIQNLGSRMVLSQEWRSNISEWKNNGPAFSREIKFSENE